MMNLTPGVVPLMECTHADGESCASRAPGHALSALQERIAGATPSKWRDGLVSHISSSHFWIGIDLVDTDLVDTDLVDTDLVDTVEAGHSETVWVWSHADLTASVSIGLPVAVHALYHTLAVGRERFNVLVAALG